MDDERATQVLTVLELPEHARASLERRAERGYPNEVCGLLVGSAADGLARVEAVVELRNVNGERVHDRFAFDPAELHAATLRAESRGLDVVGVWHTHPEHPARPSETDRAAAWEGWSYLILSVRGGHVGELRSWRLQGDAFQEERIELT